MVLMKARARMARSRPRSKDYYYYYYYNYYHYCYYYYYHYYYHYYYYYYDIRPIAAPGRGDSKTSVAPREVQPSTIENVIGSIPPKIKVLTLQIAA